MQDGGLKNLWHRFRAWLSQLGLPAQGDHQPAISDDGLMAHDIDSAEQAGSSTNEVAIKRLAAVRAESLDKIQAGFGKLIEQLEGINDHLDKQVAQHDELITRIDQLPKLLENFPGVVENQRQLTEQLIGQIKANITKDQQFLDAVEKMPVESAKQTDALTAIDHQLAAAAEADVQAAETFNKFNETLAKLNTSTVGNTEGLAQMSHTFAASDRYLKYIVSKQNKLFLWLFIAAVSTCILVILILIGIIIYLKH